MAPRPHNAYKQTHQPPIRVASINTSKSTMQRASKKNPENTRVLEYNELLYSALGSIVSRGRVQIGRAKLKEHFHTAGWQVGFHALNLETGEASNGQCFLRPRSPREVSALLKTKKPWLDEIEPATDFPTTPTGQPLSYEMTRFEGGRELWAFTFPYLNGAQGEYQPGLLNAYTRWMPMPISDPMLSYMGKKKRFFWRTHFVNNRILQPLGPGVWVTRQPPELDTSKPHTVAVIANMAPIRDTDISMGEITALMRLAEHIVVNPEYNQHTIIPITLFNMSERKVRVVQGCFNIREHRLDINISPVLDFSVASLLSEVNLNSFHQLLGWFVSEPDGDTEK